MGGLLRHVLDLSFLFNSGGMEEWLRWHPGLLCFDIAAELLFSTRGLEDGYIVMAHAASYAIGSKVLSMVPYPFNAHVFHLMSLTSSS